MHIVRIRNELYRHFLQFIILSVQFLYWGNRVRAITYGNNDGLYDTYTERTTTRTYYCSANNLRSKIWSDDSVYLKKSKTII